MKKVNIDRVDRRKKRISSNIYGTRERPRVSIFVSNKYVYAQVIDDEFRVTLVSYSSLKKAKIKNYQRQKKVIEAKQAGLDLAKGVIQAGIKRVVFDRGRYSYRGRVKALAEGLREGGVLI